MLSQGMNDHAAPQNQTDSMSQQFLVQEMEQVTSVGSRIAGAMIK